MSLGLAGEKRRVKKLGASHQKLGGVSFANGGPALNATAGFEADGYLARGNIKP